MEPLTRFELMIEAVGRWPGVRHVRYWFVVRTARRLALRDLKNGIGDGSFNESEIRHHRDIWAGVG